MTSKAVQSDSFLSPSFVLSFVVCVYVCVQCAIRRLHVWAHNREDMHS